MAGLLGGVLPAIYSTSDQIKRQIYGLLTNPSEMAQRAGQNLLQSRAERQALMGQAFANPDRPLQVTNPQALAQLGQDVLTSELGIAPVGMIAYHGTPHNILGKFDISKVGTGEGAQSYGHGMYFAENADVATQYRKALSTPYKETASASQLLDMASGNYDEALKLAQRNKNIAEIHSGKTEHIESANKTIEILTKMKNNEKLEFGNLYKVDIPDEYIPKMLDWDKPFSQQPKNVQDAIKNAEWDAKGIVGYWMDKSKENPSYTGSDLYQRLTSTLGSDKLASEYLNSIGIKGINYLDQGSRVSSKYTGDPAFISAAKSFKESNYSLEDAFEGMKKAYKNENKEELKDAIGVVYGLKPNQTSNFVVFDPTDVKILERNDKPLEGLLD